MKRLVLAILLALLLVGCRKHAYSTFYGTIDVDTVAPVDSWGDKWYPVAYTPIDTATSHALGVEDMWEIIYYSPAQDLYFFQMFGSDGNSSGRFTFNPYDGESHTMRDFYQKKGGK
jgi:hypothetical protein